MDINESQLSLRDRADICLCIMKLNKLKSKHFQGISRGPTSCVVWKRITSNAAYVLTTGGVNVTRLLFCTKLSV